MKNGNQKLFRNKIRYEFRTYTRIPLVILIILFLTYTTIMLFYQRNHLPGQERQQVITNFYHMKETIESILENLNNSEEIMLFFSGERSREAVFSFYYNAIIQNQIPFELLLYDNDRNLLFSSLSAAQISHLNHAMNNLMLERASEQTLLAFGTTRVLALDSILNTVIFSQAIEHGYAIVYIHPSFMNDLLGYRYSDHMVITDQFGYVISTTSTAFVGPIQRFNPRRLEYTSVNEVRYEIQSTFSGDGQLNVSSIIRELNVFQEFAGTIVFLSLLLVLFFIINRRFSNRLANDAIQSIEQLLDVVDEINEGNLDARVNIDSADEFEVLGDQFNIMLNQINILIENNRRLDELNRNAQIKQLEAQFNPHFLFNTLEVTRYLIMLEPQTAQEMIVSLTSLLRYSIDNTFNEVALVEDLKFIKAYLKIIEKRLQDSFDYKISISDDAKEVLVPKLIIQPIIENSIKYGYQQHTKLVVKIQAYCKDYKLFIEVEDNGSGIKQEIVDKLQKIFLDVNNETNYYGLYSVNQRLNLMYGLESKMDIQSNEEGTKVTIVIPMRKKYV